MYTFEALQILIFLIPGFISLVVLNKILGRTHAPNDLGKIAEALILSLLIYVIYYSIYQESPIYFDTHKMSIKSTSWWAFILLFACSFLLPIAIGYLHNFDLYMRLLRRIKVTNETGAFDVWGDVFSKKYRSIIVNLEDGNRLQGWAEYASSTYQERFIYVCEPRWIVEHDDTLIFEPISEIDGILLLPETKIKYIEYYHRPKTRSDEDGEK